MILINLEKARAIAKKLAAQIENPAQKSSFESAIDQAQTVDALTAIVEAIKTS